VASFCRILERFGLLASAVPALPGEEERRRALFALREAVPEGMNARVRAAALSSGEPVSKSGGDVIVPFERFGEALARYREILAATGLDAAIWGHISDGNVHPNLVATGAATMETARAAQLEIGKVAIELGGSPLAEHGTGRNPVKKTLLAMLHGQDGVESMRATKRALDPDWLLAPGVLFD
jgi:D-lactate dehydrogenase (cytochrome)